MKKIIIYFLILFNGYAEEFNSSNVNLWKIEKDNSINFDRTVIEKKYSVEDIIESNILLYNGEKKLSIYSLEQNRIINNISLDIDIANKFKISNDLKTIYLGTSCLRELNIGNKKNIKYKNTIEEENVEHFVDKIKINRKYDIIALNDFTDFKVYDIKTKKKKIGFDAYNRYGKVVDFCFTPDNKSIIISDVNGCIYFLDTNTLKEKDVIYSNVREPILSLALSPDGKYLAGGLNKDIYIWSLNTKKVVKILKGHTGIIYSLEFSPDGTQLLSSSGNTSYIGLSDNTVKLWDVSSGNILSEIIVDSKDSNAYATFVKNGNYILTWIQRDKSNDADYMFDK